MPSKPALRIVPNPPAQIPVPQAERKRKLTTIYGVESGLKLVDLREAWEYRELAFLLAWRDVKLRYAQTVLGFGWTILQPLFSTGIFTILFGKLAKVPSDGLPYPIFSYLGLLPWLFFVNGLNRSSTSLVANAHALTRVYFPRLLLPLGSLLPGFIDLGVAVASAIPLMLYFGYVPSWTAIFWLPVLSLIAVFQALGISLFFSALNVRFRDIGNLIPFALQMVMWITPITYPIALVPEKYWPIVYLNPTLGFIEGYRAAMVGRPVNLSLVAISAIFAVLSMIGGLYYFRKVESTFADIV
jgi:lipopolysaccharide transport system permease protein